MNIPMYICCCASYGKNNNNIEAVSFVITRIGDRSNEIVYKDWLWLKDPVTGEVADEEIMEEFVDKTPWVHLDIAGTADTDKEKGYLVKGATGVPVRTMVEFVLSQAKK